MGYWALVPFLISALVTATCAAVAWSRRSRPGAKAFTVILLSETLWSGGYVLELAGTGRAEKLFWDDVQYLAVTAFLPSLVVFVWAYREAWPRHRRLWLVLHAALPVATVLWVLSDPLHQRARDTARVEPAEPFGVLLYEFTAIEWLLLLQTYATILWTVWTLVRVSLTQHKHHRWQAAVIGFGLALPLLTSLLGLFGVRFLLGQRDIAPASFGVGALLITWAMFRGHFFDLAPVARHAVFAQLPDPVLVLSDDARLIDLNPCAERLLGAERTLIGQPLKDLFGPHTGDQLRALRAGARLELTVAAQTFEARCEPLDTRGLKGHVVLLRDITARIEAERALTRAHEVLEQRVSERTQALHRTNEALVAEVSERKRAEEAAQASEARFRALFEHAIALMGTLRPDGRLIAANRTALDFAGVSASEVEDQCFWDGPWWRHSAPLRERLRDAVARAAGGEVVSMEATHTTCDGELRDIAFSLKPLVSDADGGLILIAEGRDITEVKRAEKERAALKEALDQAQRLESIGRLAGGIAHDFNNLLTVIIGQTELATMLLDGNQDPRSSLDEVIQASMSAASLTRQLLAFARKQPTAPRVLSVNDLVRQTSGMLTRLIGEDVQLTLRLSPMLQNVRIDPGQLEQVVLNLAVNARDAMPDGGALTIGSELVTHARARKKQPGLDPQGADYVCLSVTDTGVGMAREVLAKIFEPFFTTKAPGKGTGIGLSTVYGIVEQAGGFLAVDSSPGKGARFEVYLPVTDVAPSAGEAVPDVVPKGHERVALVEDQPALRELVGEQLRTLGYQVTAFAKAEDALRVLANRQGEVDLLVTDVVLSGMSGPSLVGQLREQGSPLKVLYVSGYTSSAAFARGLEEDVDRLLYKPFSMRDLAHAVRAVLEEAS